MAKSDKISELTFDIDASIVFQLGDNLITDAVQAVSELVKNSYDADASNCLLDIVTSSPASEVSRRYPEAMGYISIEDDGHGMEADDLKRGFLIISSSIKREMKRKNLKSPKGRTPLGDKGLGRLSAQRLADNVEIYTTPKNGEKQYYIGFSWNDFLKHERLSQVKVQYEERPADGQPGTRLILSGLRNTDDWTGDERINLANNLSKMISPFKEIEDFNLLATVDGDNLELTEFADKLRDAALLRYFINFDGEQLSFSGRAKLDYIFPDNIQDKALFKEYVLSDGGERLLAFLKNDKWAQRFSLKASEDDNWFVEYSRTEQFDEIPELRLAQKKAANPGPFRGEIDSFDLSESIAAKVVNEYDIFNKASEYRDAIAKMSGVRVYRDGFAVRMDHDWLGLGKQWTKASSYYTLRPANTLGFVAISADKNRQLEETTDREGFRSTAYFDNFVRLMDRFVQFSSEGQEFIRRGWLKYRDDLKRQEIQAEVDELPEQITARAKKQVAKAAAFKTELSKTRQKLGSGSKASVKKAAQEAVNQAELYVDEVAKLSVDLDYVNDQFSRLREQMAQMYETVSLGLTTEALSHEIHNIADHMGARNRKVAKHIQDKPIRDGIIIAHVDYIANTVSALRKQLSHLAPSLKYVREKRDKIKLLKYFSDIGEFYDDRFKTEGIKLNIIGTKGFDIKMSPGKLNQVVDNLFLNSEYWLQEDLKTGKLDEACITVEIQKPFVRILDNGRGFDKSIESTVFEPFVTTKGAGKGRGLGLFIVKQLLDSEGCKIELLSKKNKSNRKYIVELDFTGALVSDS